MAFVRVAEMRELAPGSVMEGMAGDRPIAICNIGGQIHAMDGTCPHQGGPLGQGAVNGTSVTCPWHAWEFDCRTGENDFDPAQRVEVFGVRVTDGEIWVDIP